MSRHIAITKLSSRGQIVIPKEIRKILAWEAGDHVAVELEGDHVILRRLLLKELSKEEPSEQKREEAASLRI
ncbi:looped-hinge helix DNA binding domain-containing protein, AbrB family [Thermanaeromonas toyohensis ToBE]|uniref:Looped-hinge helix DNA binding domain-containing protein, AbrB family n=1 Tax=Thermanaeromonas toyohensis ToBE TaxID=698762 RepID=A0A1W1VKX0_9FIRM|nr:AbrB/MazE/SpoVT family DNA-binding domain-containing protein [Thermanaeromonas toyohensis]SMB93946.1 looped-hinge helix DNA binding domain-containing protein, AbrB family [Thermanaeromonas toyohensis ToBE]